MFPSADGYTAALGVFATNSGTEKLHLFVNKEGAGLSRYVSMDSAATWTLQQTIPLTAE
ncbi:hypothetical protein LEP1GSC060_1409 [Leptospira weilii serovar Ranarum str. ICFT]|uniref:Uncharacterized protein n=1 Tax=Leptospira weilii serovar Ranarum str. ICFT TaxID=1218598 RepID=N1WQU5_9LEPT|nr:hypothetical protein [Leptospira weilii]EMY78203.1 hypothetical protein LEP1GSC060_1409 [Leptospira weilii serovar Ranarum str. ICFT]